ncbi:MAG: hypothetical protein ACOCP4_04330 [Candidatus Woesearchaeota archaeon]
MTKLKIKLAKLGYIPFSLNEKKLTSWKSDLFTIDRSIDEYMFQLDSDTEFWGYSDATLEKELSKNSDFDFLLTITNVPLEDDYYARRFSGNRIVITFADISDYLRYENLKFENYILRNIYRYSLVYLMYDKSIPLMSDDTDFTHDDTRGCIFDFNGKKSELIYSLDKPTICNDCKSKLNGKVKEKVPTQIITIAEKEIKRIKKGIFIRLSEFIKRKPILSLFLTFLAGVIMSILGTWIYDGIKILICK